MMHINYIEVKGHGHYKSNSVVVHDMVLDGIREEVLSDGGSMHSNGMQIINCFSFLFFRFVN